MDVPIIDFPYAQIAQAIVDANLIGQPVTAIQVDSATGDVTVLTDSTDVQVDTSNDTSSFYTDLVNSSSNTPVDTTSS